MTKYLLVCFVCFITSFTVAQPTKIKLTNTTANCENPAISVDAFGNAHVVWQDSQNGNWEICYAKIDASGAILVNSTNVSQSAAQSVKPDVSTDDDGNAYIVWVERSDIYFAILDSSGNKILQNISIVGSIADNPSISNSDGVSNISYEKLAISI